MKRLTSFILTIALLLSMFPAAFAADAAPSTVADKITADTVWSYLDDNTDPAGDSTQEGYDRTSWTAPDFDDSAWKTGAGPFGSKRGAAALETGYTANTVLAGCDGSNDTPAYFLRTAFDVDSLEGMTRLKGTLQYDDGVIVYINGERVAAFDDNACSAGGSSLGHGFDANLQYGGSNAGTPQTVSFEVTDLSILKEGRNTVAVELHNGRQTSSDVWFVMTDLSLSDEPVVYQSNISLSVGADETEMNFTWYAASDENASLTVADNEALTGGQTVSAAAEPANDGQYSCKATASGLKANTTYYYQLANGGNQSEIRSFTTGGEGAFSFAYVGDPQIGASGNAASDTDGWEKTLNILDTNSVFSDASFLLSAGDQVNTASSEAEYDGYLDHDALLSLPVATVIGNHDSGSNAYSQHFNVANESDTLGTTAAGGDSWFVYNNVLFLVLNSNDKSPAEHKEFMEAAIAANPDVSWKIVTFHHSIYTVASHSSDSYITDPTGFKNSMAPIFKDLDIDVVLQGHDHVYCRTYMMDGLNPITASDKYEYGNGTDQAPTAVNDPEGILYVTANSGSGSKTYNIVNGDFPFSAVQNQEHVANVSKVDVSDKQFTITTYRTTDMSVVDTFTIKRDGGNTEPAPEPEQGKLVDSNTQWAYWDQETDPVINSEMYQKYPVRLLWAYGMFLQDETWKRASGPFGAKNGAIADLGNGSVPKTLLNQYKADGTDIEAYFFVTTFQVTADQLAETKQLLGSLYYDDSAVVYLNGGKVASFDEPEGGFTKNMEYGGSNAGAPQLGEFALTDVSSLKEGSNVLAVEIHQGRANSSDIYFDFQSLELSSEEPDYSGLALEQDTTAISVGRNETEMNFTWYASTEEAGTITYAPVSALVDGKLPETADTVTAAASASNRGGYSSNKATLTGLTPSTTYAYQLTNTKGDETVTSDIATFTTGGGTSTKFLFVGDPQLGSSGNLASDTNGWSNTLEQATAKFPNATFLLSAGDQIDAAASEEQYQSYLNHSILNSLPQATTIGNHDSGSNAYGRHFYAANESDTLGVTKAGGDSWFVYNGVLFLVLNSNDLSTAEHKAFMEQAIEATKDEDIQWKIVVFHHSIYSVASHAQDSDILQRRDELAPIFKELDIDVVLMGHDHVYTRSYMMDGLTPMTDASIYDDAAYSSITNPTGILYVTANSGSGSKFYNISGQYEYAAVQNQEHVPNISYVEMTDKQFTISTYRTTDMSLVDTFTIQRTSGSSSGGSSSSGSSSSGGSSSGGSSSGGGSSSSSYKITAANAAHGTITASRTSASTGTTVTVTVKPDAGYELSKLTVTDKNGSSVSLTDLGGGQYSFRMPSSEVKLAASFAATSPAETGLPFADVKTGDWFHAAAQYVYEKGMMAGTSPSAFSPNAATTRGMIVTILYRLENSPAVSGAASFGDVAPGQYYADAVAWAAANDIVKGYSDSKFGPNDAITREQLAAILYRYASFKGCDMTASGQLDRFTDASAVSGYAVAPVQWAVAGELISGMGNGTLVPQGNATRAQAAVILMRLCETLGQ